MSIGLSPSADVPGDWDATAVHVRGGKVISGLPFYLDDTKIPFVTRWIDADYGVGQPPLPGFLHRVSDQRLIEYFNNRTLDRDSSVTLRLIRDMAGAYPDDVYLQMHRIDMEARCGDLLLARDLWAKWSETAASHPDRLLRAAAHRVYAVVERACYEHEYPHIPVIAQVLPPQETSAARGLGSG